MLGLHQELTAPSKRFLERRTLVWFGLSLAIALLYSLMATQEAFSAPHVIQDDARQHVFWMQRLTNPTLFPDDWIADYFQSVAPAGYTWVYRVAAWMGWEPILFHKLLPIGLNLITAGLCFSVSWLLLPVPAAAFVATVLLGQGLGLTDAIVSATPKAFIYPLLLLWMDQVLRRQWLGVGLAIALQGLVYPQLVLISAGVLGVRLWDWRGGRMRWSRDRRDRLMAGVGITVAILVLLPYAVQSSEFGPTLTVVEARNLPEFSMPGSRARYFYDDDPAAYWLKGRSGLRLASALTPATNALGLLLPLLLVAPSGIPLARQVRPGIWLLPQMILASLVAFGGAHLLLFRLHLPSRYTQHSFRVVVTLAAAIALLLLIDAAMHWARGRSPWSWQRLVAWGMSGGLAIALLTYPLLVDQFPITAYQVGTVPELYAQVRSQPPDTLIASLSSEANNLPSFTGRSVLVAEEYAIPYHQGYYTEFRQRVAALTQAQYSPDGRDVVDFIDRYGVDVWLLDRWAFDPDAPHQRLWVQQYPDILETALAPFDAGERPALSTPVRSCQMWRKQGLILLDATCVKRELQPAD